MAKVTAGVAYDKMLIGEDHQRKEQKNNSSEAQQQMDVYNLSAGDNESIRQGNGVKTQEGLNRFQQVDEKVSFSGQMLEDQDHVIADSFSQLGDSIKVTQVDKD